MKSKSASKIKLTSYDELIGGAVSKDDIQEIPIGQLRDFVDHPFHVNDDDEMNELVESIKTQGILTALLVRPSKKGGYEIVSGHRRKHAAVLAGLTQVPVIIREMSDDDAVRAMVDSNLQREHMTFIPEGDVYRLITKSHLPSAQRFESWVFDEILPAIRKTGGYMSSDLLESVRNNPEILLEFAQRLLDENNRNRELQSQINDLQPKANYFDHFMVKGECSNIRTTAKEIGVPERKFVEFLLKGSFLYRSPSGTLLPYAVPKNESLFIVRDFFNNGHLGSQTLITPKGKEYFRALFEDQEEE